ncbi:hypothetical protein JTE90_017936 [Oedothorax gibbosus]|uniref:Uncharacterized protein n=1 Tax=Oedothorax gibbosus TaxID=931172 RepID=A0AAV6V9U4_9ARAC|nr:hypothetical protein JTE90_017936 [Oedothorax gibbosus]
MIPSHLSDPQPVTPASAITVDRHVTVYVLLAGVAGGIMLAVVVMVCCKVCLRKKKQAQRQHVAFSRYSHRNSSSRSRKYHSLDSAASLEIETSCGYSESSPSSRYCPYLVLELELHPYQGSRSILELSI